jgi:hypothetical protein
MRDLIIRFQFGIRYLEDIEKVVKHRKRHCTQVHKGTFSRTKYRTTKYEALSRRGPVRGQYDYAHAH